MYALSYGRANRSFMRPAPSLIFFALVALALNGCTHVRHIDEGDPDTIQSVNLVTRNATVLVLFDDGRHTYARDLVVTPMRTRWTDLYTGRQFSVPTSDIYELQINDRTNGMIDGLGLGILAGASMGMIAGLSMRSSTPDQTEQETYASGAGVLGGALVGGLGLIIGGARGATQCYRFRGSPVYSSAAPGASFE